MRYSLSSILYPLLLLTAGCGVPSFLITPVQNTNELNEITVESGHGWSPSKIVIIDIEGMIANAKSGGFLQPTENKVSLFTQELELAAADPSVKAVILRVNSPGGTVTASDIIYQQILQFRKTTHKTVIASTQELAASGGYYICCAADKIIVHPTSVVGSIGVIFQDFDLADGMSKLGIRSNAIKSAPMKDMGSPFHHLSDDERAIMQGMVDEYYARFRAVLLANRPLTNPERIKLVTDGRVFTGMRAVELGLADQSGTLTDAIALAKTMSGAPNASVIMYKRPYGYSGSIYAQSPTPQPQAAVINLNLPESRLTLPTGFYYLWEP